MAANGNSGRRGLVLLSGLPGAGKTTFARALARGWPLEHLESDAVRRAIRPEPRYDGAEHARVFAVMEARARNCLQTDRDVVVDATNLTRRDRKRFVRLAQSTGAVLVGVRLTAPGEVIRKRLAVARQGYSQAGADVYEIMLDRAQPFSFPVVTVDSRFDVAPSVELVQALLENG